jgi:hypothetical protein
MTDMSIRLTTINEIDANWASTRMERPWIPVPYGNQRKIQKRLDIKGKRKEIARRMLLLVIRYCVLETGYERSVLIVPSSKNFDRPKDMTKGIKNERAADVTLKE